MNIYDNEFRNDEEHKFVISEKDPKEMREKYLRVLDWMNGNNRKFLFCVGSEGFKTGETNFDMDGPLSLVYQMIPMDARYTFYSGSSYVGTSFIEYYDTVRDDPKEFMERVKMMGETLLEYHATREELMDDKFPEYVNYTVTVNADTNTIDVIWCKDYEEMFEDLKEYVTYKFGRRADVRGPMKKR